MGLTAEAKHLIASAGVREGVWPVLRRAPKRQPPPGSTPKRTAAPAVPAKHWDGRQEFTMDMSDVADRLRAKLGLGSRPDLRGALYQSLEALVHDPLCGARAYEVIASVVADAVGKSDPGRYFAHVVQLRLREKGIIPAPQEVF